MATNHFKNWWFLTLNGIIFILFGVLVLFSSRDFIATMVTYFGIIILIMGIVLLIIGINNFRKERQASVILLESVAAMTIGLILTFFPEASVNLVVILIGAWIVIIGIIQLVILVNFQGSSSLKTGLLINGLLTVALGVSLFFNPFTWAVFLIKAIGVLAVIFGLFLIWFSFRLRSGMSGDTIEPKTIK